MGHYLDLKSWKRREHFELYRGFASPFFSVCADVDATATWERCREPGGPSFFLATTFLTLRAANAIEAFRTRVRPDGAWVHDQVSITPTVMRGDETFAFAKLDPAPDFASFAERGADVVRAAKEIKPLVVKHPDDDLIYHSTLPWIHFTSFSNALNGNADSVPRIVFGKCARSGSRWMMPVGVEVHHAVVDGLDIGRFLESFEKLLSEFRG